MLKIKNLEGELELKRNRIFARILIVFGLFSIFGLFNETVRYGSSLEKVLSEASIWLTLLAGIILPIFLFRKKDIKKLLLIVLITGTTLSLLYEILSHQNYLIIGELFFALFYLYYLLVPLSEESEKVAVKQLLPVFIVLMIVSIFFLPRLQSKRVINDIFQGTDTSRSAESNEMIKTLQPVVKYIMSERAEYIANAKKLPELYLLQVDSVQNLDSINNIIGVLTDFVDSEKEYLAKMSDVFKKGTEMINSSDASQQTKNVLLASLTDEKVLNMSREVGQKEIIVIESIKALYIFLKDNFGAYNVVTAEDGSTSILFDEDSKLELYNELMSEYTKADQDLAIANKTFQDYVSEKLKGTGLKYEDITEVVLTE